MPNRRFQLELPISVTCAGANGFALAGKTKNISSTSVVFTADAEPDPGEPIEYVITLSHDGPQSVDIRCVGKVLQSERMYHATDGEECAFQISATLERYKFIRDTGDRGLNAVQPPAVLTRLELRREIAQKLDVPLREAEQVLETIIAAMVRALRRDGRVEIRGFGVFSLHQRGSRSGRNPKTGANVDVPAKKIVHFKPSKEIARSLLAAIPYSSSSAG
ncbi:MAG: HU family DNA-binding protein [Bryobacteraceae bacterium]